MVEYLVGGEPEEGASDCPRGVHGSVESECPASLNRQDSVGDERVARCPAHALAESVDAAGDEHRGPRHG